MININILAERIKERRQAKGLKQKEIAEKLNISRETISAYETGRAQPTPQILLELANILETSVDYLLGRTDDPRPLIEKLGIFIPEKEEKIIPVYNSANAGVSGSYPDGQTIVEYLKVSDDTPAQFGVIVHGDSMEPEIMDGDIVLVNKELAICNKDKVLVIIGKPYFSEPLALIKIYRGATRVISGFPFISESSCHNHNLSRPGKSGLLFHRRSINNEV